MEKRKSLDYAIIWILFIFIWMAGNNPVWANPDKNPGLDPVQEVIAEFESLKSYIQELPDTQLTNGEKQSFIRKLNVHKMRI